MFKENNGQTADRLPPFWARGTRGRETPVGHEVVSLRAGTTRQRATTKKPKTEEAQRANELFEFYLHEERCAYVCKYVYIYIC